MPKHATVLNLLPISEVDESLICSRLGVKTITLIPGRDMRKRGAREGLNYARKIHSEAGGEIFAINSRDWGRQSQRTSLYTLACLIRTSKRIAIDLEGNIVPLTWLGLISRSIRDHCPR